ncbi:MAG: PAS domain-containing protein [Acidobacteria bacterium]|nr:PAS domain-containing protein [Acidobacteriota bacterium]
MRRGKRKRSALDVRTRLLLMLAVLSLPLLIVGLYQLYSYRKSLSDQSAAIARTEAEAAAGALESWIESHPAQAADPHALTQAEARELFGRLTRRARPGTQAAVAVYNPEGRAVSLRVGAPAPVPAELPGRAGPEPWSDGVNRVTFVTRTQPSGWSVAAGVPAPDGTPGGRSLLLLAAAWMLTLTASFLLAVWAVGRFTRPIRSLVTSATALGEGRLHERARVETDDEVGTLAESFNAMAVSLESKFEAVKLQSAFIGEVLDSLPLCVVVLDAKLFVRKVNAAFARVTGRPASELTGRGLYDAAAGLSVLRDVVEDVRRTRRAFVNYGQPLRLAAADEEGGGAGNVGGPKESEGDAQKFWDVTVWPVTEQTEGRGDLILILSEVSKRVRAERLATAAFAAEKSRAAELASVINQMDEGVVIVDREGRYRLNRAAARVFGRREGEFEGGVKALVVDMTLRDTDGRVLAAEETPICRALSRGEHVSAEQYKVIRGEGEERVLSVSATPLRGEGGRAEGVVAVFRDTTEGVRKHEELLAAYGRLREHDRLKSAFVANMSHELRTPLNVIIGLCQLLSRDPAQPLAPLQADAVGRMERNGRALLEMVNDMLDYSRLESGRSALCIERLEAGEVIRFVANGFEQEAREKNIELRVEVSPEVGVVSTDRRKLTQVMTCLVSNALKFTSAGSVSVSAGAEGAERWYIEVTDTGIGMSSDALAYIFDGFRQVDDRLTRSYNGVGLGLAITRRIVELLGGEIKVESRQNEGSRFRIIWPREAHPRTGTGSLVAPPAPQTEGAQPRRLRAV